MNEQIKIITIDGVEYFAIEESQKQEIEFRVYYDDNGKILFYTCEKPEGNYLVIDRDTFAAARPDVCVVDGVLTPVVSGTIIIKYMLDREEGISCAKEDISIIVDKEYPKIQKWKLTSYELR